MPTKTQKGKGSAYSGGHNGESTTDGEGLPTKISIPIDPMALVPHARPRGRAASFC